MSLLSKVYITTNLAKLKDNIQYTYDLCKEKSVNLAVVTKSICADAEIISLIDSLPVDTIADSRLDNFAKMSTNTQRMLIRPSAPTEAGDVVKYCDISFQTDLNTVMALDEAANSQNKKHDIILLIDMGDLRDGIYFSCTETILALAAYIHTSSNLNLTGIATNYNCFAGLLADDKSMEEHVKLNDMLLPFYDTDSPIVSGGNSSTITYLINSEKHVPSAINQFRIGEAVMLGRDPADNTFIEGYKTDVFTLHVPLIEVCDKPISSSEVMRRGVLSVGKQDLQLEHIIPTDSRIKVLGGCSDECVIDLTDAPEYKVGDEITFIMEYGALMTAFAGSFIRKVYI